MATSKVFYENYLTSATVVSAIAVTGGAIGQAPAVLSDVQAVNAGNATLTVSGTYTALTEKTFYIEAYIVTDGAFSSTRLHWSNTAYGTWNVENITPVSGVPISLSDGVSITLTAGASTPQFQIGDQWQFKAVLKYGPAKALDGYRDSEWRSGAMPTSSTVEWRIDLGSTLAPGVIALLDHNIPSNATVQLFGTASNFTTINTTTAIPWNSSKLIALVSAGASRYWVLRVTLGATSLPYLRFSELFLGAIESFSRTLSIGFTREKRLLGAVDIEGTLMRGPGPLVLEGDYLQLNYEGLLLTTDVDRFTRLRNWTISRQYNVQRPFYFVLLDSTLTDFSLYQWANAYRQNHLFNDRYGVPPEFAEVVRSIA